MINRNELIIRFAEKRDIDDIVSLMRYGFSYILDKIIYGCSGIETFIEDNMVNPSYKYFVVLYKNKVAAALEYRITENENILNYIVVGEDLRGQRLAGFIFESTLLLLPTRDKIVLDVFSTNTVALKLYENLGFHRNGTVEWNEIILNEDDYCPITSFKILDEAENTNKMKRYGFSIFRFTDGENIYEAGLLGKAWIRITGKNLLKNKAALDFLKVNFPDRRIFCITEKNFDRLPLVNYVHIIDSQRMER